MAKVDLILPDRFIEAKIVSLNDSTLKTFLTEYISSFKANKDAGIGVALFGNQGTGKSYAAAALARALVSKGNSVMWAPTVEVFNQLLDFKDYRLPRYFSLKSNLKDAEVVIFDDFSQLHSYPRIRETFFEVIDTRYAWKRPTIFTANFIINKEEDWNTQVASCFNNSLARRIRAMTDGFVYVS